MEPIRKPNVLNPRRVLDNDRGDFTVDHQRRAALLEGALQETSAYAVQLWDDLAAMRTYLLQNPPFSAPGATQPRADLVRPVPVNEEWQQWIDACASVTSVLCGPHGDSGYGAEAAREVARMRGVDTRPRA